MKNVFIGLAKFILAVVIVLGIAFAFVVIEYSIVIIIDYFADSSKADVYNFGSMYLKWLFIYCLYMTIKKQFKNIKINEQSKGVYKLLAKWRKERNITHSNYYVYCGNIIEELLEPIFDDKKVIEAIKQEILNRYFVIDFELNEIRVVDTICDIQVFSINELGTMKYNTKRCMLETIKEISSRQQDPKQKEEWAKNGDNGKWQKSLLPEHIEKWYKADYNKCKLLT